MHVHGIRLSLSEYFGKTNRSYQPLMSPRLHIPIFAAMLTNSPILCYSGDRGPVRMQDVFQCYPAPTFPSNHALSKMSPHTRPRRSINYKQRAHCCVLSRLRTRTRTRQTVVAYLGRSFLKEQKQMRVTSCERPWYNTRSTADTFTQVIVTQLQAALWRRMQRHVESASFRKSDLDSCCQNVWASRTQMPIHRAYALHFAHLSTQTCIYIWLMH